MRDSAIEDCGEFLDAVCIVLKRHDIDAVGKMIDAFRGSLRRFSAVEEHARAALGRWGSRSVVVNTENCVCE